MIEPKHVRFLRKSTENLRNLLTHISNDLKFSLSHQFRTNLSRRVRKQVSQDFVGGRHAVR